MSSSPAGDAGGGGQGWGGSGRGDAGAGVGSPGPWGAAAGKWRWAAGGEREICGCEWMQVRVRYGLLMPKKGRGNVAGPNGREEKSAGMQFLAGGGGGGTGEDSKLGGDGGRTREKRRHLPGGRAGVWERRPGREAPHALGSGRAAASGLSPGLGSGWVRGDEPSRAGQGRASEGRRRERSGEGSKAPSPRKRRERRGGGGGRRTKPERETLCLAGAEGRCEGEAGAGSSSGAAGGGRAGPDGRRPRGSRGGGALLGRTDTCLLAGTCQSRESGC